MTRFAKLSAESQNIVFNLYNKLRGKSILSDTDKQIMVSLYGTMPFAKAEVLQILREYQIELTDYILNEEVAILQKEFDSVILYCFQRPDLHPNGTLHTRKDAIHLPTSLVDLCIEMAGDISGKSVYLPFAGEGSFAAQCENSLVTGFESNSESWAIAQILTSVSPEKSEIELKNCFSDESELYIGSDKYDYVFTFPPILNRKEGRKVSDTIYQIITKQLNENGELYMVLPQSFCYDNGDWFDVRKILLDYREKYSVLVISLPPMLQPETGISICLVNFIKDGKGLIGLVDATGGEFFARNDLAGYKHYELKTQSVLETIKKQDEKYVWVGKVEDLKSSLDLSPARYLLEQNIAEMSDGHKSVMLRDLIESVPFERYPSNRKALHFIGMKELSSNYLNCDIHLDNTPLKPEHFARVLPTNALLAGFINGKFKVGKINELQLGQAVALRSEVSAFKLKSKEVSEDYLLRSLLSKAVEIQANALAKGLTISRLATEDLLEIRITVPSLEEQERICKEDSRASLSESDRKLLESFEEFREDMHMKKHAIGQTIFNLNNWWKALQKARKEGNGDVKDSSTVGKNQPITVREIYDSLDEVIKQLQQQINKFDRGNGLIVKNFAPTEFIEDYISRKKSPLFEFKYDGSRHRHKSDIRDFDIDVETGIVSGGENIIFEAGSPIEYIDFAPEALEIIFDNIVSNACSHGFDGREDCLNFIKFELFSEDKNYILTISNNGTPLNEQVTTKDVFTYSRTSKNGKGHFGIGGYEVKKLMREFGGDAEFISDPNSEYPVTYKLIFHNTNIISVL